MSNPTDRVEIITSVQRRRRWTAGEKVRMVEETFEPGMTVSRGSPTWRCPESAVHVAPAGGGGSADGRRQRRTGRAGVGLPGLAEPGAGAPTAARQEDAGSRDPQGGARTRHGVKKTAAAAAGAAEGRFAMKTVTEGIGVSRSNWIDRIRERARNGIGRPPLQDETPVAETKAVIAELPPSGYRVVHAIPNRQALAVG